MTKKYLIISRQNGYVWVRLTNDLSLVGRSRADTRVLTSKLDRSLVGAIKSLAFKQAPKDYTFIKAIIVQSGLGSFTQDRLAVVVANSLGWAGKWPVILYERDASQARSFVHKQIKQNRVKLARVKYASDPNL